MFSVVILFLVCVCVLHVHGSAWVCCPVQARGGQSDISLYWFPPYILETGSLMDSAAPTSDKLCALEIHLASHTLGLALP